MSRPRAVHRQTNIPSHSIPAEQVHLLYTLTRCFVFLSISMIHMCDRIRNAVRGGRLGGCQGPTGWGWGVTGVRWRESTQVGKGRCNISTEVQEHWPWHCVHHLVDGLQGMQVGVALRLPASWAVQQCVVQLACKLLKVQSQ